jgi:uncharacterized protein (TIGR04255 family)
MAKTRSLHEVIYVAHFATPLTVLDTAAWYNSVSSDYPIVQQQPPWDPVVWQNVFPSEGPPPRFLPVQQFIVNPTSMPRIVAFSEDQQWTMHIQHDRIVVGWRRLEPTGRIVEYPGFTTIVEKALTLLERFRAWWLMHLGTPVAFTICELNYFNAFPFIIEDRDLRLSEIFKFVVPQSRKKVAGLNASWFVQADPLSEARVQCVMAMGATMDCPSAALFNFFGMAKLAGLGSPAELRAAYGGLHGSITSAYTESVNIEIIGPQE